MNSSALETRNSDPDVEEVKVKREEGTRTTLISHEMCLSCLTNGEERKAAEESKESLEKVHTFAELEHDPRASLPSSFTVCATLLSVINNQNPMFFTLLGKDGNSWFQARLNQVSE